MSEISPSFENPLHRKVFNALNAHGYYDAQNKNHLSWILSLSNQNSLKILKILEEGPKLIKKNIGGLVGIDYLTRRL